MHAHFAILSSRIYVFLPILYAKIIMLHKARYVKKMGLERGGGADQKKTTNNSLYMYFITLYIINQFIKPFLDNKMPIFEEYGAFNETIFQIVKWICSKF